jgi:hypothetical protein
MATLTVSKLARAGVEPTFTAATPTSGDTFLNNGQTFLIVRNAGTPACTVTINSQKNCDQGFDHDQTVSVPGSGGERWIGPLETDRFNDASTGEATVTYSVTTDVTVAAGSL